MAIQFEKTLFRAIILAALLAAVPTGSHAADSPQEIGNALLHNMDKIASALERVEDEPSARAAAQDIAQANAALEDLTDTVDNFSDSQKALIFQNRLEDWMQVQTRLSNALQGMIHKPELMSIIGDELDKMPEF